MNDFVLSTCAQMKEKGNKHFAVGEFEEAIKCYTDALNVAENDQEKLIFYKNRAACYLKLVSRQALLVLC